MQWVPEIYRPIWKVTNRFIFTCAWHILQNISPPKLLHCSHSFYVCIQKLFKFLIVKTYLQTFWQGLTETWMRFAFVRYILLYILILYTGNKNHNQSARMHRQIEAFIARTYHTGTFSALRIHNDSLDLFFQLSDLWCFGPCFACGW